MLAAEITALHLLLRGCRGKEAGRVGCSAGAGSVSRARSQGSRAMEAVGGEARAGPAGLGGKACARASAPPKTRPLVRVV